jgi:hypothetical protein
VGLLERTFRSFIDQSRLDLDHEDLRRLYDLAEHLAESGQAGVLRAIELRSGRDALRVELSCDPTDDDDLDLSMVGLCQLQHDHLDVQLIVTDDEIAGALGVLSLENQSTEDLTISISHEPYSQGQAESDKDNNIHGKEQ